MEALQAGVDERHTRVATTTARVYLYSMSRFMTWLCANRANLLTEELLQTLEQEKRKALEGRRRNDSERRRGEGRRSGGATVPLVLENHETEEIVKTILLRFKSANTPPINFELLGAKDFLIWLISLRKPDGSKPSFSTYNTHRAALFNLFREYNMTVGSRLV